MKNSFGHFNAAELELAQEMWDFQTCQRADGSYYGTGGTCRLGTPVDKVEKLDLEGVESLLSSKTKNSISTGMDAVNSMDDVARELVDKLHPEDAKKIEKYDDMIYGNAPLKVAQERAEKNIDTYNGLIKLDDKLDALKEKTEAAKDKWLETSSDKDLDKFTKSTGKEIKLQNEMAYEAAKIDSKTAELVAKRDKEQAKLDSMGNADQAKWDKQYEKTQKINDQINDRVEKLVTDSPVSRKLTKDLDARMEKVNATIESVTQRRDELESRMNDRIGDFTWADNRAVYSAARGGPLSSEGGKYQQDSKQWTDQVYKQLKAAGYNVKKSDVKEAVEDTLLSDLWGDGKDSRIDSFYSAIADLT